MVDKCEYELPTNLQNFEQKDLTEVKIFHTFLVATFLQHPVHSRCISSVFYSVFTGG